MKTQATGVRSFGGRGAFLLWGGVLLLAILYTSGAHAAVSCARTVTASIVAIDQPVMFNRLGASNINATIFALERDVVITGVDATGANIEMLRPDKRPRPLVLRVRVGDCLTINLRNGLRVANPFNPPLGDPVAPEFNTLIDDQVADRHVSLNVAGMQWVNGPQDDGSLVGNNLDSTVPNVGTAVQKTKTYQLFAEKAGAFAARGLATTVGSDANQGNAANLLFGEVIVEPANSAIYRSQVTEEELRLASMDLDPASATCGAVNTSSTGHPVIDYEARYPNLNCNPIIMVEATGNTNGDDPLLIGDGNCDPGENCVNVGGTGVSLGATVWDVEGKAGLPVLNMIDIGTNTIVHSEINAFVGYGPGGVLAPAPDGPYTGKLGHFPKGTYPLESVDKRNPTLPNRLEPFRDFASVFHDEPATKQAFPGFYEPTVNGGDDVFRYVLAGVKDGFMINYGSGGIGSEIIANRLGVGPMHDCLTCAYEEFFLTSYTVGDPAQLVDVPANVGLEALRPGVAPPLDAIGPKATKGLYTEDPANIHHSYTGDFAKIRNVHVGKEQHVFHLHNHQWLYNPNDDNSNYLDAQGIGPGSGYTYEINFGGSGNRNKSAGDSIFHCHFYPHFAQGMWYHWRHHDVFEAGTRLQTTELGGGWHVPFTTDGLGLGDGTPANNGEFDAVTGNPMPAFETTTRALPDGEVAVGVPIPAVVPLPGKPMAPMPGRVTVVPKVVNGVMVGSVARVDRTVALGADGVVGGTGANADINPGFPFWVAGIEDIVGQRPTSPPLDMLTKTQATALKNSGNALWTAIDPAQADGWDGGLPRAALEGIAAGGHALTPPGGATRIDFSKVVEEAQAVFYPEEGTDLEQLAMAYHAVREHPTCLPDGTCDTAVGGTSTVNFVLNGAPPVIGAPYHEPCIDDEGDRTGLNITRACQNNSATTCSVDADCPTRTVKQCSSGPDAGKACTANGDCRGKNATCASTTVGDVCLATVGDDDFFGVSGLLTKGSSIFSAANPRIYKGTNIQYDAVFNKAGYHYPQQRIITLWQDAVPVITKEKAGQPLLLRLNTFDCAVYHHSNLVPENYEVDDYQVRTPTDIIGQHIHLPKWDLTTADGSANGWNYEDGTLSPGAVQERIHALNEFKHAPGSPGHRAGTGSPPDVVPTADLVAAAHPYFSTVAPPELATEWLGARTTMQRWFADPVVNTEGVDRGLGIIFTHDHYGPSTHQQIGLYATVLAEPAGSTWVHNETGEQIACRTPGERPTAIGGVGTCRWDGGPTAWQAAILPQPGAPVGAGNLEPFREFYFEYSDFQHAYEAGVYVGAGQLGEPLGEPVPGLETPVFTQNTGNPDWNGLLAENAFRFAINPPAREENAPVFPDLVLELANTVGQLVNFCPSRPCPQAIDVQDPGMFVVNYRNEPVGLRIFDPNKPGPDAAPGAVCPGAAGCGMQADGPAGDLAFALANKDTAGNLIRRKFEVPRATSNLGTSPPPIGPGGGYQVFNFQPKGGQHINGTVFPPSVNSFTALKGPDPFTPMLRTMAGDLIRVKMQAGGHEEEHNATIHGVKWLQTGSGHGTGPNSGWRNAQAGGISEQFTLAVPVVGVVGQTGQDTDYAYSLDAAADGWMSGMWGILRVYKNRQNDLLMLPTSLTGADITNSNQFVGPCPAVEERQGNGRNATTVKNILNPRPYDVTAVLANDVLPANGDVTIADPTPLGHVGTHPLVPTGGTLVYNPRTDSVTDGVTTHFGPIHDPTAILYVRTKDLMPKVPGQVCYFDPKSGNPPSSDPAAGPFSPELATCDVVLRPGAPIEPLVLRAAAGECLVVTLRNALPPLTDVVVPVIDPLTGAATGLTETVQNATTPDLASYTSLLGVVKRDRLGLEGSTTFQPNLMRASSHVGLHPQLVETDGSRDNGILAGTNSNTLNQTLTPPGAQKRYLWYAGHINATRNGGNFTLSATPVEFGAANLQPADTIKQGQKSMVGQLVIEPKGATWTEDGITVNADGTFTYAPGATRTQATVNGTFRDFSTVWTKALTHYYADSSPVEHINGEGAGIPEDPQESTGMAINYGIEPVWFRLGILPNAAFGNALSGTGTFGGGSQFDVFSNAKVGGDPATPVFTVAANQPFRMRVTNPYGTSRGTTFQLNGHVWPRDPYICPGSKDGIPGRCATNVVGSQMIGNNRQAFYQGGQESITPATHFDIVPTQTGLPGDHLFRDSASFGSASGLWGIVRVE